ncbi:MAG: efflux RND transporter periplasmic adaptor subunit [Planctomycetota bacterium]
MLRELRIDREAPRAGGRVAMWFGVLFGFAGIGLAAWAWTLRWQEQQARNGADAVNVAAAGNNKAPQTRPSVAGGGDSAFSAPSGTSVLDATGYVVARRKATVSSKVTGKVKEVLIEEGQVVKENEVLARLDRVDAETQRDLAAAQLASSNSTVDGIKAQLAQAESSATRLTSLHAQGLITPSELDIAVATRDNLRAQLLTAQRNVHVAEVQLEIAVNAVNDTEVRAPFAGVITAKAAQPGEIVSPLSGGGGFTRTGIGTIVDMDSLEVEVDVNESYIGRVRPRMPVEAVLNAYPDWRIPAEVIAIIPTADRSKATVKVRIGFRIKDSRIVPEMGVRVSFLATDDENGESRVSSSNGQQ